jgi:23S rRNA pseudoU1915 N3-methylase RlmH
MAEQLSRKKLYDLVWSEPMRNLSVRFGISDVALKKTCARAGIPTPDRGYWAKKQAGKETFQAVLPMRPPGMDDEVSIASGGNGSYQYWNKEETLGFVGAPPQFAEPIETIRARIAETVDHVAVPHKVRTWHPAIDRLLKEDEKRREKQLTDPYSMSWDKPLFDTPFERRRLRILNSLFLAVAKMNGKSSLHGREAREIRISFFQQHLCLTLDRPKRSNRHAQILNTTGESSDTRLCLSILSGFGSETVSALWQDEDAQKVEVHLTDVAVQAILTAEIQYRERALHQYHWRVQRKAELEEEERKRKLEAERAEKERKKRIEQARINRLLRDAAAFQQAGEIRKYVEVIRSAMARDSSSFMEELEQWSKWALAQADRIDPAVGGRFLEAMRDEEAS